MVLLYIRGNRTIKVTQAHLGETTPQFIKKDEWFPQSLDCKSMVHAISVSLMKKVYQWLGEKSTKQSVKGKIIFSWEKISIEEIRERNFVWKKPLRLVIVESESHRK